MTLFDVTEKVSLLIYSIYSEGDWRTRSVWNFISHDGVSDLHKIDINTTAGKYRLNVIIHTIPSETKSMGRKFFDMHQSV